MVKRSMVRRPACISVSEGRIPTVSQNAERYVLIGGGRRSARSLTFRIIA